MKMVWVSFILMLLGATLIFYLFQRNFSDTLFNLALQPKVQEFLSQSMEDQRTLSDLQPENKHAYRARFDDIKRLRDNFYILEHSREGLVGNFQIALMSLLIGILAGSGGFYWRQHRRRQRRLEVLQEYLVALSEGQVDIKVPDQGKDLMGDFGRMIEKASGVMARQRRRLAKMDALTGWQEAARRHAHEIRTPLTAARMEVNAMAAYVRKHAPQLEGRVIDLQTSVNEELDQLKEFTAAFTSFAKIGKPQTQATDVHAMAVRFAELFAEAWDNLEVRVLPGGEQATIHLDKEMVRRVLVNLCNNSALAVVKDRGTVQISVAEDADTVTVDVRDDGPGIPEDIRPGVFKPYTTSRKIGEGMGLGLSIAQKIMLDHGGDLILLDTGPRGTCFRLIFPKSMEELRSWQ